MRATFIATTLSIWEFLLWFKTALGLNLWIGECELNINSNNAETLSSTTKRFTDVIIGPIHRILL